ncbi:MAG: hypothetical protein HY423_04015 [Candidatus Lambdaproteobacteria bacterium]|nr:hypothetical protein [Candidatus Lambdaproteobacteria bacterium]
MIRSQPSATQPPTGETSRYAPAIARCVDRLDCGEGAAVDGFVVQALTNLVQGRMLEYLADRICRDDRIDDPEIKAQIATALLRIISDEFFALFRAKVEASPDLAVRIARSIVRCENMATRHGDCGPQARNRHDRLYPALFQKYFEYRNTDSLLALVSTDAEIQRILLLHRLSNIPEAAPIVDELKRILCQDEDGTRSTVFMQYLDDGRVPELIERVRTGSWTEEPERLAARLARLRGN